MKSVKFPVISLIAILALVSFSCKPAENRSVDDWATVTFSLKSASQNSVGPLYSLGSTETVLISAVPADYALGNNQTIPSEYFDRNLLNLEDYTIALRIPLGRSIRLIQNVYEVARSLDSITTTIPVSSATGISDAFKIYSTAESITVQIDLIDAPAITTFGFAAANNSFLSSDVVGTVDEINHTISVAAPFLLEVDSLVASFTTTGQSVSVGNTVQTNNTTANDFTNTVSYTVVSADGSIRNYAVTVVNSTLTQQAYIKAVNSDAADYFGASISLSGNTLAVGARKEDSNQATITNGSTASSDNSFSYAGAVYVYTREGSDWSQQAYIKSANNDIDDDFGYSVSLSGDTLAVGAGWESSNQTTITNGDTASADNNSLESGAVYVYTRSGSTWSQQAYIKAANNDVSDFFGNLITLSGDTLAVNAGNEGSNQTTITNGTTASADNSSPNSGAVYIYTRSGVTWTQQAYIKAVNNDINDRFGNSLSLSGDTLAVGTTSEDSNQTTITNGTTASADNNSLSSGAVYVYIRSGSSWSQQAYIKAANNNVNDFFGKSVSLSGNTLAVGAYMEDSNQTTITHGVTASADNSSLSSGAVYVYSRSGSDWSQQAYIKATSNDADDYFGVSVSLSDNTLAVAAYMEDSNQTTITHGDTASDDNSSTESGAVYLYTRSGTTWSQRAYIKAVNNNSGDNFGEMVFLQGATLAIGAPKESSNQTTITNGTTASADDTNSESGAVYVYY